MKLENDELLSTFAFNFNLRRYSMGEFKARIKAFKWDMVGWCRYRLNR